MLAGAAGTTTASQPANGTFRLRPYTDSVSATDADARVFLNPFEEGFFDDPYRQYARLREEAPVHRSPIGVWTLTRYDDVSRLLRDPSLSVVDANASIDPAQEIFDAAGIERQRERESRDDIGARRRFELVEEVVHQLLDARHEGVDPARCERLGHQPPDACVVRRIQVQDGA